MGIMFEVNLDEGQIQMILLALAELSLERPGWHPVAITECVKQFVDSERALAMYEEFREIHRDRIKPIGDDLVLPQR